MWTSLGLNLGPPDYESTGVMMNTLPSWTGENWTLNVGITGINTGFLTSTPKPWTKIKQKKALEEKKKKDENDKFKAL